MTDNCRAPEDSGDIHAILLYAGKATRLGPLSEEGKALIRIHGRPMVCHQLTPLAHAGVRHATVVVKPHQAPVIRRLLADLSLYIGIRASVITQRYSAGPGAALAGALAATPPGKEVLLLLGDTYLENLDIKARASWIGTAPAQSARTWCKVICDDQTHTVVGFADEVVRPEDSEQVAVGIYYFTNRKILDAVADSKLKEYKSDTSARKDGLQLSEILSQYIYHEPMITLRFDDWIDLGDWHASARDRMIASRTRSFNCLTSQSAVVLRKSGSGEDFEAESLYLRNLRPQMRSLFPRVIHVADDLLSYDLEYIDYPTLAEIYLYSAADAQWWSLTLRSVMQLLAKYLWWSPEDGQFAAEQAAADINYLCVTKLQQRFDSFCRSEALATRHEVKINGHPLLAGPALVEALIRELSSELGNTHPGHAHGDLCMSNILFSNRSGALKLIDPRGMPGTATANHGRPVGDVRYDIAKLRHSYHGGYDAITHDLYRVDYILGSSFGFRFFDRSGHAERMDESLEEADFVIREIALIEATQFLSLLPLHFDSPARQRALYLRAVEIANEALSWP